MSSFTSEWLKLAGLKPAAGGPLQPAMATVQILCGRKEKMRAGDVLGALTQGMGFSAAQVGKITVNDFATYVAVERGLADAVLRKLNAGKVKGKSVKARLMQWWALPSRRLRHTAGSVFTVCPPCVFLPCWPPA